MLNSTKFRQSEIITSTRYAINGSNRRVRIHSSARDYRRWRFTARRKRSFQAPPATTDPEPPLIFNNRPLSVPVNGDSPQLTRSRRAWPTADDHGKERVAQSTVTFRSPINDRIPAPPINLRCASDFTREIESATTANAIPRILSTPAVAERPPTQPRFRVLIGPVYSASRRPSVLRAGGCCDGFMRIGSKSADIAN